MRDGMKDGVQDEISRLCEIRRGMVDDRIGRCLEEEGRENS